MKMTRKKATGFGKRGREQAEPSVPKVTAASFRKSGQVCTSVQRLYVERALVPDFVAALRQELEGRTAGDPLSRSTFVGPSS